MPRLTETRVKREPLPARGEVFLRCSEIKGFCARITSTGSRSWCVEVKGKRTTLGAVGVLAFEGPEDRPGARDLAIAALGAARKGANIREAITSRKQPGQRTLNEIWKEMEDAGWPKARGTEPKSPNTIKSDCNRYDNHIRATLGHELVDNLTTAVVRRWADKVGSASTRGKLIILVKSILSFADSRGMARVHPIKISVSKSRILQNFYAQSERERIDAACVAMIEEQPAKIFPLTIIRLLLRTGARSGEIMGLRWSYYHRAADGPCAVLRLPKDKTNRNGRDIDLDPATAAIIDALPRIPGEPWMFPSESASGHMVTVQRPMDAVCDRAGVPRHRIHDLRHSYISSMINRGVSLFQAGANAGHVRAETTMRYAHLEKGAKLAAHAVSALPGLDAPSPTSPKKSKAGRKPWLRVVGEEAA